MGLSDHPAHAEGDDLRGSDTLPLIVQWLPPCSVELASAYERVSHLVAKLAHHHCCTSSQSQVCRGRRGGNGRRGWQRFWRRRVDRIHRGNSLRNRFVDRLLAVCGRGLTDLSGRERGHTTARQADSNANGQYRQEWFTEVCHGRVLTKKETREDPSKHSLLVDQTASGCSIGEYPRDRIPIRS